MFNLSGGEIVVILVLALIVIGPERLPDAVRKAGRAYAELRKLSAGFQAEIQDNLGEPLRAVQDTVNMMRSDFQSVVSTVAGSLEPSAPGEEEPARETGGAAEGATNGDSPEPAHRAEAAAATDATPPTDVTTPEGNEPS